MIISMICWGSWANTMKLTAGYAFQLFYWDYVMGILVGSVLWGFTLGSAGGGPLAFVNNLRQPDVPHIEYAIWTSRHRLLFGQFLHRSGWR